MPTAYTEKIVKGEMKTFKEFAILCSRAFGASIHMRDEPLSKPYVPREVDDYQLKQIQEYEAELQQLQNMPDEQLINNAIEDLEESIRYYEKHIEEAKQTSGRIDFMLEEVKKFVPPTEEHTKFKDFMISQLEETKRWDGYSQYEENELSKLLEKLNSKLDATVIRKEKEDSLNEDIAYHKQRYEKDVKNCNDANKWVEDLLDSLEKQMETKDFNKGTGSIYMDARIRGAYGAVDCLAERHPWIKNLITGKVYDFLGMVFSWWSMSWIGRKYYDLFERGE